MIQKYFSAILLLLSMAIPFRTLADSFYIEPEALELGKTGTLRFYLDNSAEYYGFQAEVKLPAGLEAVKGSDGDPVVTLSGRAAGGEYQVNSNVLPDGTLIMGAFSGNHNPFSGTDGLLADLKVSVAETFNGGTVVLSNVYFIDSRDKDVEFNSTSATLDVAATEISLSETSAELKVGGTIVLTAAVTPENATDKTVKWSSDDTSVATVDASGKVTAKALGEAVITAACGSLTAMCEVSVIPTPVESLEVQDENLQPLESGVVIPVNTGDSYDLTAVVRPADATDRKVTWTSSDEDVATVDANGLIDTHKAGEATITASVAGFSFTAKVVVTDAEVPVTGVSIDRTAAEMKTGATLQLNAVITPEDATTKDVTWTSSDKEIATVSKGLVTALKAGKVTVTATANKIKATCEITITDIEVTQVTLDRTEATLTEGETMNLTAIVTPDDATDKSVTWTSSDENVATVDGEGKVVALKPGSVVITAKAGDKSAECSLTVKAKVVVATDVILNKTAAELKVGATVTLTATVAPDNTTDKTVVWTSDNEAVAAVDANGKVTAKAIGEAVITAACGAVKASCKVTVIPTPVETVAISETSLSMTEGDKATLTATVAPDDATDKTLTWTSSDETVATVSADGEVTALKAGSATITVASSNGKTASCTVTVKAKIIAASGVTVDKTAAELKVGESVSLTATVAPDNATDKTVVWSSSDEAVAVVDKNGKVTAKAIGEAVVTAACGDVKATCKVTVIPTPVDGIFISRTELSLTEGGNATLTATVTPADATDKSVVWSSSDEAVATVDGNGKVTAVGAGQAVITAAAGGKTATCVITVEAAVVEVAAVVLDRSEATLTEGEGLTLTATVTPADATDAEVVWSSSDEAVATVDANGKVSAIGAGQAVITAAAGGKTATCVITVEAAVVEVVAVVLDKDEATLTEGESLTLTATVTPADATDKSVVWSSSDETVATVDGTGKVTAIGAGQAVITAAAGGKTATCVITVEAAVVEVSAVTLDRSEADMQVGEILTLTATVTPADATDAEVVWSSSDEAVATVDANGIVTAVGVGQAVITAEAGGKTAGCTVKVDRTTGIDTVGSESCSGIKVYDLNGLYVSGSTEGLTQGTYIIRRGGNAVKIRIR